MPTRITLKDIAQETGYTVATVSRALSGKDQIAQSTRDKVRAAAARLGYQPDPALARLAAWRWGSEAKDTGATLAVLMDYPLDDYPWYIRQRLDGVARRAKALGYHLLVLHLKDYRGNVARVAEVLKARGIRGILIERIFQLGSFNGFPWQDFFAIGCGFGKERLPIPTVCNDLNEAVRQLWRRARERGYRRIGVIMGFGSKVDPYYRALSAVTLEQSLGEILDDEFAVPALDHLSQTKQSDPFKNYQDWYERYQPDAILMSVHDVNFLRKNDALPEKGYACYDWSSRDDSPITRAYQSLTAVGELAVELCHLELLQPKWHSQREPTTHLVGPEMIEGETLPQLAAASLKA